MGKNRLKKDIKRKNSFFIKILKLFFGLSVLAIIGVTSAIFAGYLYVNKNLPKISSLKDYSPPIVTNVYSDDNKKIAEFFKEKRIVVDIEDIPKMLINSFVSAEDSRFFKHQGIDFISIFRAVFKNLEAGGIKQGGSTITQQVAKSFFLSPEKKFIRKIKEAVLAYRIDKYLTKEEILYLYLNQIYLGHGSYGVEAASENYFGKSIKELSLAECAILAGLPQAPSKYSPFQFPEKARERQTYVLNRMVAEGYITNRLASEAMNTKLDIKPRQNLYMDIAPYYTEHIRRYIEQKYGADVLYKEGLNIYTVVNIDMQKDAWIEVEKGVRSLDKRQGFRGALKHLAPDEIEPFLKTYSQEMADGYLQDGRMLKGVVSRIDDANGLVKVRIGPKAIGTLRIDEMSWARRPNPEIPFYQGRINKAKDALKISDVVWVRSIGKNEDGMEWHLLLEQNPTAQGALICIETKTGYVKAMVGGRDFRESKLNRAIQAKRQPGSAFKPIIYAAALDKGYTPSTVIIDSPIVFDAKTDNFSWKPKNYDEKFNGPTLMRDALAKSLNIVTIKILQDIGVDYAIDYARKLGVTSTLNKNLSLALGSAEVSLLELTTAYSVFANQGYLIEPIFITKILNRDGKIIEKAINRKEKVIEKTTAYLITSLLESVVKYGTGKRVSALNRPVAGKTGTTNDLRDAWFIGFTPSYVTGAWVGIDENDPLGKGETGGRAASPIWLGFMKKVLEEKPIESFQEPEGIVHAKIDAQTGLLPILESKNIIDECFKEGTVPAQSTKKSSDTVTDEEDFLKSM